LRLKIWLLISAISVIEMVHRASASTTNSLLPKNRSDCLCSTSFLPIFPQGIVYYVSWL
jgi:hypothetical protein